MMYTHAYSEDIQSRINLIRNCQLEILEDKSKLSNLICELGLYFASNDNRNPKSFIQYGNQGLRIWQNPDQLAAYLIKIKDLKIDRYIEIGVAAGGTFITTIEYLKRFGQSPTAIAVDPYLGSTIKRKWVLDQYLRRNPKARLIQNKSIKAINSIQDADLIFIDGNHKFEGVRSDYLMVRDTAGAIALHDILGVQDVCAAWHLMKQHDSHMFNFFEFTDLPEEEYGTYRPGAMLGIGLAIKNEEETKT